MSLESLEGLAETLRGLTEAYGPSGHEEAVRERVRELLGERGQDARVDALGNLIVRLGAGTSGHRVVVAAHMDEIGLIVHHVDEQGFLRVTPVGGVRPHLAVGQRLRFPGDVVGTVQAEVRDVEPGKVDFPVLFVDVGASDRAEAEARVPVGSVGVLDQPFRRLGETRAMAKAMDDRSGVAVLVELARRLTLSPHEVYLVFTVQEEVGLRGATVAGYGLEPTVALAVDVTLAGDFPKAPHLAVGLGRGPAIKVKDGRMLAHPGVRRWLEDRAREAGLPYQLEVLPRGSTDAAALQVSRAGVPAGTISIPCRYVHSPSEVVDLRDLDGAVRLLQAALEGPIPL